MGILKHAPRKIWSFLNIINNAVKKDPDRIFIYSNLGFRDNVRAVYDHLIENGYNKKYKIVCSLNDYEQYRLSAPENVRFTGNFAGIFHFFRSRYCFYCFGKYPVKPADNQTVINLWHGMPMKRIGNMEHGNEKTDYNYFSYLLCTSEFFRDIMKKSFSCTDEQIFICGEPRTDVMMNDSPGYSRSAVMTELFGDYSRNSRLMVWLPTFRKDRENETELMTHEVLDRLNELCRRYNWSVLIKLHPLSSVKTPDFSKYEFISIISQAELERKRLNLYTVLRASDCLVTDYSSVYFDYILLDRPMGFTVHDLGSYRRDRGFVFDDPAEYMPGHEIKSEDDLIFFAQSVFTGNDKYAEKRRELCRLFNEYQDGGNCRRVLEKAGIKK
ncbi:MAG: CDP-glycerol glycerophosphotransferase family protein [Porcipelethomonas sp.]